jgi:hypothetical protein
MTPLNSIKRYWIGYLLIILISAAGCSSNNGSCPGCSTQAFLPTVNLKITDPSTKQDLFFGSNPKFTLNDLKIKHVENGKIDSISSIVKVDSTRQLLNIDLKYQHDVDTLSIQVGTMKPQVLYLSTGILNSCCTRVFVTSATFNGALIFTAPTDPKQQAKMDNVITIPL